MTSLTKTDPRDIDLPKARLHATGIEWKGELTAEEYADLCAILERQREGHKWWMGDLIVYGELREDRWGHKYNQALAVFGDHTYHELAEFASVARNVPPENRRKGISWSAHAAVRTLPPEQQVEVLESAGTVQEVRQAVRQISDVRKFKAPDQFEVDELPEIEAPPELDEIDDLGPSDAYEPHPGDVKAPAAGQPTWNPKPVDAALRSLTAALRELVAANPGHKDHHDACKELLNALVKRWDKWKEAAKE